MVSCPHFAGEAPDYRKKALPDCTHDSAILAGVMRIFDLQPHEQIPGDSPWRMIYKEEGRVTPREAKPKDPSGDWESVDDSWHPADPR